MFKFIEKHRSWLLPIFLILFILEVITLPLVIGLTYSGRSENPDHVITYTTNKLTWDSATGIDDTSSARLSLFSAVYDNVESENSDKLIAPGTSENSFIRLKNEIDGEITYTAVLYEIKSNKELPVETNLLDSTFTDTDQYTLPDGIDSESVIRAVTGTVAGGQIQDFDISWIWDFYESEEQDIEDTVLGNKAEDDITIGFYIVVEDDNVEQVVIPDLPKTGDNTMLMGYVALMAISAVLLLLTMVGKRRDKKCEE